MANPFPTIADVYVLRWHTETIGVFRRLEGAQALANCRAGEQLQWKHHDSHGPLWKAPNYSIEVVSYYDA